MSSAARLTVMPVRLVQVDTDLTLSSLRDATFDRQITKDLILEDTLRFLLPTATHLPTEQVRQQDHSTDIESD